MVIVEGAARFAGRHLVIADAETRQTKKPAERGVGALVEFTLFPVIEREIGDIDHRLRFRRHAVLLLQEEKLSSWREIQCPSARIGEIPGMGGEETAAHASSAARWNAQGRSIARNACEA
ncbi:hypothetical protein RHECNPAF_274007 [Rhizobium etli CNPAF512]|nr:hypothetical protein RHECNPAF_274007 [Rhizobium etli CNPAF512]